MIISESSGTIADFEELLERTKIRGEKNLLALSKVPNGLERDILIKSLEERLGIFFSR